MLSGSCPAFHQDPGNKENTPPIIWLYTWIDQAIIYVFFLFCFHVHHFRQSLWWLQLQPNHQLSKINKRKLQNSKARTMNMKNVKCCLSAHTSTVCQLCCKITFYWFLINTIWFFWTWSFLFLFLANSYGLTCLLFFFCSPLTSTAPTSKFLFLFQQYLLVLNSEQNVFFSCIFQRHELEWNRMKEVLMF